MNYQTDIDCDKGYNHAFQFALGYRVRVYRLAFSRDYELIKNSYNEGVICGSEPNSVSAKYHTWYYLIDRVIINDQVSKQSWLNGRVADFCETQTKPYVFIVSKKVQPLLFGNPKNFVWL